MAEISFSVTVQDRTSWVCVTWEYHAGRWHAEMYDSRTKESVPRDDLHALSFAGVNNKMARILDHPENIRGDQRIAGDSPRVVG